MSHLEECTLWRAQLQLPADVIGWLYEYADRPMEEPRTQEPRIILFGGDFLTVKTPGDVHAISAVLEPASDPPRHTILRLTLYAKVKP